MSLTTQPTTVTETLTERRSRWSALLRKGHFQAVIEEVLEQEKGKYPANSKSINFQDRVALLQESALILASAPSVFTAAVDGDLLSRIKNPQEESLRGDYKMIQQQAERQPSIYIHLLADKNGVAPTANQYLHIGALISEYIAEGTLSEHAYAVDNIATPHVLEQEWRSGCRKYLRTKKNTRWQPRVENLKTFCEGIKQRWHDEPESLRDTALRFPPGECGYSEHSHKRLAEHSKRKSSNHIMNLVEDICTYLHKNNTFTQHFVMHQFIIYLIFRPNQAAIAETFCSGLLQVWVDNGGGFNAHPAGISVASAKKVSAEKWEEHERLVRETSPLDSKIEAQREKASQWREALEWETGEVDEEMADATD